MLKNLFLTLFCASVICLAGSGCVVVKEYMPAKETVKVDPQEYELARKLIRAFVKNDAEGFIALLPVETRAKFTVENFKQTRKSVLESIGEPVAYSYLTTLELSGLHPQIWKVQFKRFNVNRTKEFTSEALFKVVTGMTDRKTAVITGFHFM